MSGHEVYPDIFDAGFHVKCRTKILAQTIYVNAILLALTVVAEDLSFVGDVNKQIELYLLPSQ
jgi:hypothetical protein